MKTFVLIKSFQNLWSENFKECVSQLIFNETIFYNKTLSFAKSKEQFNVNFQPSDDAYYPGYARIPSHHLFPVTQMCKPNYVVVSHNARLLPYNIPLPFGSFLHIKNNYVLHPYYKEGICDSKHLRYLDYRFSLKNLINDALSCINVPYVWGGRTIHSDLLHIDNNCGVDCSGFINLLFRAQGFLTPRDSHQQFLRCLPYKNFDHLPIGGLIFLTNQEKKIVHVILKLSNQEIIDAEKSEGKVRILVKNQTFSVHKNTIDIKGSLYQMFLGTMKKQVI